MGRNKKFPRECPFCGSKTYRDYGTLEKYMAQKENRKEQPPYTIKCIKCGAQMVELLSDTKWNRRVHEQD